MYSLKLKRAAAAVALATAASVVSVGAAGTATAAPSIVERAPQRFNTNLSASVKPGGADGSAVVQGRLKSRGKALANRKVRLLSQAAGATGWTLGRVQRTGQRGYVRFAVKPSVATSYQLVFFGAGKYKADRSRVVSVAAADTKVSINASPIIVASGGTTTIKGVVTDAGAVKSGVIVELRARKQGSTNPFEPISAAVTAADGSVSFSATPVRNTSYALFARKTETTDAARSAIANVAVQAVTALSIQGVASGETYTISGRLTSGGKGFANRNVYLQRIAPGTTAWENIQIKKTGAQGNVSYTQPLVATTQYRLVFVGDPLYTNAFSSTVVS